MNPSSSGRKKLIPFEEPVKLTSKTDNKTTSKKLIKIKIDPKITRVF
jgi:hypothetical protein